MKPVALTIAGSDPSGGAGIQADLKTFHQFGVYGMSVITLLTVQNTENVFSVDPLDPGYVEQQLEVVTRDIPPQAAKTGALGTSEIIEIVAAWAQTIHFPVVVDPVMISKHGAPLIAEEARQAFSTKLLPSTFLVTPNLHEAAALAGQIPDHVKAVAQLRDIIDSLEHIIGGRYPEAAQSWLRLDRAPTTPNSPRLNAVRSCRLIQRDTVSTSNVRLTWKRSVMAPSLHLLPQPRLSSGGS